MFWPTTKFLNLNKQYIRNYNRFLSACKSYGMNEIDSLVVGRFSEVNLGIQSVNLLLRFRIVENIHLNSR